MKNIIMISLLLCGSIIGQLLKQNFYAEKKIIGGAKEAGEYNFVEYSVKSNSGKELYQIVDKADYDIPYSKLEVFEDGSSVLINSFYGTLTFISNDGSKTRSVKIKDNLEVEYERTILSVVDGGNLLILFGIENRLTSTIKSYNKNGVLKNEFELNIKNVNGLAFSESMSQIYLSHLNWENSGKLNKKVTLLKSNGEVVKSFNANFESGFFTKDNQFVGVSNKSVFLINTSELKLSYEIKVDDGSVFIDVTENNNSIIIAQTKNPKLKNGKWYYNNPTIKLIDPSGIVVKQTNYKTKNFTKYKFNLSKTKVEFATDKEKIRFAL